MRGNNVLGILFSNSETDELRDLTGLRTMASVPFGSRYRMIDYPLSNMENSGIDKVAVIAKSNYQSLLDHLGSGKAWNLAKNTNGLFILPPFGNSLGDDYANRIQALNSAIRFLERSKEEFVLLSDCDMVCNIDYKKVIAAHIEKKADITIIYKKAVVPKDVKQLVVLSMEPNERITEISIDPNNDCEYTYAFNMYLMRRDLLIRLVRECASKNTTSFTRDLIQSNVSRLRMYGYNFKGYSRIITSMSEYFNASMDLMSADISAELYDSDRPIYTKVRDDMPAVYCENSNVKNSLVAHGCIIEGEVKNSILFKGVHIGKGCKIENCIIMQDSDIGDNSELKYIVADKDVTIKEGRQLIGYKTYPIYINKNSVI